MLAAMRAKLHFIFGHKKHAGQGASKPAGSKRRMRLKYLAKANPLVISSLFSWNLQGKQIGLKMRLPEKQQPRGQKTAGLCKCLDWRRIYLVPVRNISQYFS